MLWGPRENVAIIGILKINGVQYFVEYEVEILNKIIIAEGIILQSNIVLLKYVPVNF